MIKHYKIYWSLVALSVIFHIVAMLLTWYAIEFGNSYECNSIMSKLFGELGYFYSGLFSTLLLIVALTVLFFLIMFIYNDSKYKNFILISFGIAAMVIMGIDMCNDIFAVVDSGLWNYTHFIIEGLFKISGIKSYC